MNYKILKNIIENLVQSFTCPSCNTGVDESNLEIIGAAGSSININVACPECHKNAMIKTEVAHVDLGKIQAANIPEEIKGKIRLLKSEVASKKKTYINDEQIISLNKKLKSISGVEELFKIN